MTPRRLIAISSLAALIAAPAALLAQPPDGPDGPDGPHGPPPMMMRGMPGGGDAPGMVIPLMLHAANLTPEQRDKAKALMSANREPLRKLFDQLKTANDALAGKLVGPAPVDAAALKPEVERIAQARQQLMEHGLTIALGLRAILTPEQLAAVTAKRAKLEDLQRQMRELMRD
ncbi:periplasmic heavy metal sensor [bacterium]|nr:periplasmic heavy metal sensor [bacterium]